MGFEKVDNTAVEVLFTFYHKSLAFLSRVSRSFSNICGKS